MSSAEPDADQPDDGSVTHWLRQLTGGDQAAARPLWEAYFQRMVELARRRLPDHRRAVADEEDVALSAFKSFCRGAQDGRFPRLMGRDNLWPLLVAITAHKAKDLLRREGAKKRGGDIQRAYDYDWQAALGDGPSPEFEAMLAEEMQRLFAELAAKGPHFVPMIQASLAGDTTAEIAARFDRSVRSVQRKLDIARAILEGENPA